MAVVRPPAGRVSASRARPPYPLSAVVGMDDLRLALVLNAVSPAVGGVLVRGEKGTAKSTAVRGLAAMLPPVAVIASCRFACEPGAAEPDCPDGPHSADATATFRRARLVELPVGASEDRVTGSIDLDRALADGVTALRPGLLAAAHRGLLYVDEVNLLNDHLVDLLLDAAALGETQVERDGISLRHVSRFLLVGTMNPEEGELRPQLLDRFGLTVEVTATREPALRAEVVRRRLDYEADPRAFAARWAAAERAQAARIVAARARLSSVRLPDAALRQVTAVCAAFDVDGLRADVVLAKASIALAAWEGRETVDAEDVRRAARLALPHRRRRGPFDAPGLDEAALDKALDEAGDQTSAPTTDQGRPGDDGGDGGPDDPDAPPPPRGGGGRPAAPAPAHPSGNAGGVGPADVPSHRDPSEPLGADRPRADGTRADGTGADQAEGAFQPGAPAPGERLAGGPGPAFRPRRLEVPGVGGGPAGRRARGRTGRGAVVGASVDADGLHLAGTLNAAAPHQAARGRVGRAPVLRPGDRRGPVRVGREGNLVLFVVDASGSMAARTRMRTVTTAVLSLLLDAYQRRDRVGMITFRGAGAEVVLPPTSSVDVAATRLASLPTGGRTPLAAGLVTATVVLRSERRRDPSRRPLLVVVTDGRSTHGPDPTGPAHALARSGIASVVVDCESGYVRLGLAGRLAEALGAPTIGLDDLAAGAAPGQGSPGPSPRPARRAA
ncbi:MAG: VWA domain-containing protein [Frankia sp.]